MLHVHALDRPDALGEVEHLRLAERRQGEEAGLDVVGAVVADGPRALPHDRRVEALLDDRPHRGSRARTSLPSSSRMTRLAPSRVPSSSMWLKRWSAA